MVRSLDVLGSARAAAFCAALAAALAGGCGSDSPTATTATGDARGTLIEDPPLRIASLDAAAFSAQLGASSTGQQLLTLAGTPACGVDFYYFEYWTVGAQSEPATASGALMVPTEPQPSARARARSCFMRTGRRPTRPTTSQTSRTRRTPRGH